jgi:tetratricopeptide (TPR) repeat protein
MLNDFKKWFYRRLALNYMTAGKPGKAERWYKKLERFEPDTLEVLHNLGVIYIALNKHTEAEKYLLKEIDLYGESEIRNRVLGDLYYVSGNREMAGQFYGRALNLLQNGSKDKSTERFLRRRVKHCSEELSYEKVLKGMKHYEEGAACYARGDYDEALYSYNKAVKCDNSSYLAMNAAGTLLMNNIKDYEQARQFFRKALELADIPLVKHNLTLAENKIKMNGAK